MDDLSDQTRRLIEGILPEIKNKRARIVIEHILQHGHITTEDLENYGYRHPPRAARDVREAGIPLETFRVKSSDGSRTIAAYRFGDMADMRAGRLQGRSTAPRKLKRQLYEANQGRCAVCAGRFEFQYLQVDHRVPYEITGEAEDADPAHFMLLCGSCNRAKSWSCEHCPNWERKSPETCAQCYWASPEDYRHIATVDVRRMDVLFAGKREIKVYEWLKTQANEKGQNIPDYVKITLETVFEQQKSGDKE
ncbi:MAG TPA: HNH endonuclease [Anaerolineae bacterium]|nr:HNH endonuclease [Anaerolineae bacterium]